MPSCVFCPIIAGKAPAHVVLDEPGFVAFLDVRPVFPGHVLLVPRQHIATFPELPADQVGPFFQAAQRLAVAVEKGMKGDGTFVAMNNKVSQSVPHLHVHVVPRKLKDGLRGFFWPRVPYKTEADAAATAEAIRTALGSFGG